MRAAAAAALFVVLGFGLARPAGATLVGVGFDLESSPMFSIAEDGSGVEIGQAGASLLNSLGLSQDGTSLISAGRLSSSSTDRWLVDIDLSGPTNAMASPLARLVLIGTSDPEVDVRGLTYDLGGTLFMINDPSGALAEDILYTVDVNLGTQIATATQVGATGFTGIQALTVSPLGELFAWDIGRGLSTINPSTGVATDVNPGVGGVSDIQAIAFVDGRLFGARNSLFEINPITGEFTEIGAILPFPGDADIRGLSAHPVPEPGTWALLLLGLAGLRRVAGRRSVRAR
jgi:hypothetical protein